MFNDGSTLDVVSTRDDSDVREAALLYHFGKRIIDPKDGRIEGVATLPYAPPEPEKPRRVVRKSAAKALPS
jgi:hypothetical protein